MVASFGMGSARWWRCFLFVAPAFLASPKAVHASGEQPIRIAFDASPGCPDGLAFFSFVRGRTALVRLAGPNEAAAHVFVKVESAPDGAVGTLELENTDGTPFVRKVQASTCSDVLVALSLVLALAYDPDAAASVSAVAAAPTPSELPPSPSVPTPSAPPPSSSPLTPSAPPPLPTPTAPSPSPDGDSAPATRVGIPPPVRADFGIDGHLVTGVAPSPQLGGGPFVEFGTRTNGWWTPRVRAQFLIDASSDAEAPSGRHATLSFLAGRIETCPVTQRFGGGFELSPCVALEIGRIQGEGAEGVDPPKTKNAIWIEPTVGARIQWELAERVFVEALASIGFPFPPDSFQLTLSTGAPETVFQAPPVSGSFAVGAGVRFR